MEVFLIFGRNIKKILKFFFNRSGQGSLTATIVASTLFATIVASATSWYLSMNDKVDNFDDKLEAMSVAMSEWQRLEHMSLEDLENKRTEFKTPWSVGNYKISVTLGEQGTFTDGKCTTAANDEDSKNCFKDTIVTVYDNRSKVLYTTRTLPLLSRESQVMFPDFSKVIDSFTMSFDYGSDRSFPYVVPKDGYLRIYTSTGDQWYTPHSPFARMDVTINGQLVQDFGDFQNLNAATIVIVPVKKGDIVNSPRISGYIFFTLFGIRH